MLPLQRSHLFIHAFKALANNSHFFQSAFLSGSTVFSLMQTYVWFQLKSMEVFSIVKQATMFTSYHQNNVFLMGTQLKIWEAYVD